MKLPPHVKDEVELAATTEDSHRLKKDSHGKHVPGSHLLMEPVDRRLPMCSLKTQANLSHGVTKSSSGLLITHTVQRREQEERKECHLKRNS